MKLDFTKKANELAWALKKFFKKEESIQKDSRALIKDALNKNNTKKIEDTKNKIKEL